MTSAASTPAASRTVGRYTIYEPLAAGGMASVHFGRLRGAAGFGRTVAIKRLRSELAPDPAFVTMLADEARLTSRIQHPNVVVALDVVADAAELFIVLEYVHGESLGRLVRLLNERGERSPEGGLVPARIAAAIMIEVLRGLHGAHEARGADGQALELVHRDVSPQNVMVDVHGRARVLDFGVAKARQRDTLSNANQLKGKLRYMAPEQVHGKATPRSDLFAAGVVLWELLVGAALFPGPEEPATLAQVLGARIPPPSERGVVISPKLEATLMRALDRRPEMRFATARDMANELAEATPLANADEIARWMRELAAESLERRERRLQELDRAVESSDGAAAASSSIDASRARMRAREWPGPSRRRHGTLAFVAGGAAALVAASAWTATRVSRSPTTEPPPTSTASSMGSSSASPSAAEPPASTRAPFPAHDAGSDSGAPRKRPTPPPKIGPASKPACDPPFEIDAHGVKVYKRECFPTKR